MVVERAKFFDVMELVRRVEAKGFKVSEVLVNGPSKEGNETTFSIRFNPVGPAERVPVEEIIRIMGLDVDGGGTDFGDDRKPTGSDVTFCFRKR